MKTITIEFNNATDFHIFEPLFRQFNVKVFNPMEKKAKTTTKKKKRDLPIETATPNERTHKAFVEMQENRHALKGYTDVNQMIKDILEDE